MKDLMKILILFSLFVSISITAGAQTSAFEGTVSYDITYEEADQQKENLPFEMKMWLGDNMSKVKMKGGGNAMTGEVITHGNENASYILMPQQKMAMKVIHDKTAGEEHGDMKIENTGEKKNILGYSTTKYKVVVEGESGDESVQYMWLTKELTPMIPAGAGTTAGNTNFRFSKVEGFPLMMESEVEMEGNMTTMTMKATEVTPEELGDDVFAIPADYTVHTMDPSGMPMGR